MLHRLKNTLQGERRACPRALARSDASDATLLRQGVTGFDAFYRRHYLYVLRYVGHRVRDTETVLDVVNEVFAAAYLGRAGFDPDRGCAEAWLTGIAKNKIAAHARDEYAAIEARHRLGLERHPPSDSVLAELDALLAAADLLADLPRAQRAAVWERHVLDRRYGEIAADAGVSEATVRKRVSTGLARLARQARA
ncbi:MAG: RNA polymerase sigma factor [Solirubrobacterales bacterium]|nr:RNA polymerase sigma factor [Solirubrobacterales bacterium]